MEAVASHFLLSFSSNLCKAKVYWKPCPQRRRTNGSLEIVARGMLAPRKFMQRRKKEVVFEDAADETKQRSWRRMMREIEEQGCTVQVLRIQRTKAQHFLEILFLEPL